MSQARILWPSSCCAIVCLILFSSEVIADSGKDKLPAEQEKKINAEIHALSTKAESAADFSTVIDKCRSALNKSLSDASEKYVKSTLAYCLNQRGAKRLDLAEDFLSVANEQQAEATAKAAKQDFDESISVDATRWATFFNRATYYCIQHDYQTALKDLDTALQINPGLIKALSNRAEINYHLKNYDQAIKDYEAILAKQSGNFQAITGRSHCWFAQSKFEQALKEYELVVRLQPGEPIALVNRGDAYMALRNWQAAYDDYQSSVTSKPTSLGYQQAAWLLATCPEDEYYQPETALSLAEKAIQMDKSSARAYDAQAAALAALGRFEEAISSQQKAIELDKSNASELKERLEMYKNSEAYHQ